MKIINIKLPSKKDEVLVSVVFSYGYITEKDSDFGLGHLIEHYIVSILEEKYKPLFIDGTIDNTEIIFEFSFKKKDFNKFDNVTEDILNDIKKIAEDIDMGVIENEKKRIEIELEEKYSDILNEISWGIESKIIKTPSRFKRRKTDQIKNIKRFKSSDIKVGIKKLLGSDTIVFVGYDGNVENPKEMKRSMGDVQKMTLNKKKNFKLKNENRIIKKAHNYAVAFPVPGLYKKIDDYATFLFLSRSIYYKLEENTRSLGAYKTNYEFSVNIHGGYIWYFVNSYMDIKEDFKDIFFKAVNDVLDDKELNREIKKFKEKSIRDAKSDWKDFHVRFEWVIEDILNRGYVKDLDSIIKGINMVDIIGIKKMTKKVFRSENIKNIKD